MKKRHAFILLLSLMGIESARAESGLSVGIGIGALYSGIGANVGIRTETSLGYLAAGCPGLSHSTNEGWDVACGVGAGWIWTNVLPKLDKRHGLGIYLGPVGTKNTEADDLKASYGAGVTYAYFFGDGIARGWNLGATPTIRKQSGDYRAGLMINAGYQF